MKHPNLGVHETGSSSVGLGTPITAGDINKSLIALLPTGKIGDLVGHLLSALLLKFPLPTTFAIGTVAGWFSLKHRAEVLYERAFAQFNEEVLGRIPAPRAFDPLRGAIGLEESDVVLPWIAQAGSARREVWDQAMLFATREIGRDPAGGRWDSKPVTPFGWTLLMGRPGSGKSRLAVELARFLARREHFGTAGKAGWRDHVSVWWHVQVRRSVPRPTHAWDAGWLRPGVGSVGNTAYPEWEGRRAVTPDNPWLGSLRSWRPRRPTLLLLDDPRPGDSKIVVAVLEASAKQFRHAVRLLIVNQSAPAELGLAKRNDAWSTRGGLSPLAPPILLSDESCFNEADIRQLRFNVGQVAGLALRTDPLVMAFLDVTRGNPLLVELGLKWLRAGLSLRTMTESALLTDRVDRVVEALCQAGLTEAKHHRAIAVATLAGGARNTNTWKGMDKLIAAYPLPSNESTDLARIYPVERLDLRNALPAIRPDMIGDAFVRRMVKDTWETEQTRMVATAWVVDPSGTLRNALRLGGTPGELGALLRTGPPADAGIEPVTIAMAYIESAIWFPSGAKPESREANEAYRLATTGIALCGSLAPVQAAAALEQLLVIGESRGVDRPFLADTWLRLVGTALGRVATVAPAEGLTWVKRLFAIVARSHGWNDRSPALSVLSAGWTALLDSSAWGADQLSPLRSICQEFRAVVLTKSLSRQVAQLLPAIEGTPTAPASYARAYGAAAFLARLDDDPSRCRGYAETVDRIAAPFPEDRDIQLQRTQAWGCVAYATRADAVLCRGHAETVDRIAAPFPEDRDIQFERTQAWHIVAYATRADAVLCRGHAETVDRIAAPFPEDRDIQFERTEAWGCVAYATQADAVLCRGHAETGDRIAAPFPEDRDIQLQRTQAWRCVAYATRADAVLCRGHAETVDRIAAPFPEDRDIQFERTQAWHIVAYATRADAVLCRGHAETVDRIAAPFPEDCDIQFERTQAWRIVAYATRADAVLCRGHAETVDRIAAPFPEDRDIQLQRTHAWRHVASATRADAVLCRGHAETVDRIAAPFPEDRDIQLERAQAWRNVADKGELVKPRRT